MPACEPAEPQVGAADRAHPDLVGGAGPERAERRRERRLAERLQAGRRADHRLLRDVHLDEALGSDLLDVSVYVELLTSPSSTTRSGSRSREPGERPRRTPCASRTGPSYGR
jgi:hypothetical protein